MRKALPIYIIALFSLFSCARDRSYVKISGPSNNKSLDIHEAGKDKSLREYMVNGKRYYPLPDSYGFVESGKASWYGEKFHGKTTASGEIYDMHKNTAAHKTLPMGTYVKVLNLSNNKYTIVRINDRGPFVKDRIIDLSYSAAKKILLIGPGVTDVKITALGKEIERPKSKGTLGVIEEIKDLEEGEFTIQIGAFENEDNAARLADRLKPLFDYVNIEKYTDRDNRILYRVHVSKSETLTQAGEVKARLKDMGLTEAFIVRI